ncbi:hypothetical protein KKF29_01260, partial [Patescibacteria group bacterium]|nr:hypothetical protein [Patescibacteria group bacterium]
SRRIQIAKMILQNVSHEDIKRKMKVGFQTIYKVERWLRSDEKRMKFIVRKIKKVKNSEKILATSGLNKYAHHRFLKNLIK